MDNLTAIKAWLTAGILLASEFLGMFGVLLVMLLILFGLDYITAMVAAVSDNAKVRNETEEKKQGLKSALGIKGILKKFGYMCLVALACLVDGFLFATTDFIGIKLPFAMFFGTMIVAWLSLNEMISILENLDRSGANLPSWLVKIVQKLKINVDSKVEDALIKTGIIEEDEEPKEIE